MNNDPIVDEVRSARDKLARRFNYDIHAIFADLRRRQHEENSAHPLVNNATEWPLESEMTLNDQSNPPKLD